MTSAAQTKPTLRGSVHYAAFYVALGAGAVLVASAHSTLSRQCALSYILSLVALFGASALYHRPYWDVHKRQWLRRLDHASIYYLMAGSATPVFLLAGHISSATTVVSVFWVVAFLGSLKSFFWPQAPKAINVVLYISVGFLASPFLQEIGSSLGLFQMSLLTAGSLIYIVGALIYYFRFPNPFPKVFGYHEIFHSLVVLASLLHFWVIFNLVHKN